MRCGYHGLKFDAGGSLRRRGSRPGPHPAAGARAAPTRSRCATSGCSCGWATRRKAEERLLPDNFSNDHPDWRNKPGYLHYDTPYLLICDNLLDFSHLSYVHEKTLGGSTAIAQARPEIEALERGVRVTRRVPSVPPPPYYQKIRNFSGPVDRWFIYDFLFPGTLLMSSGGKPAGQKEPDPANSVMLHSCQTLTPETETTTHYFFQQSHRADAGDAAVTEGIFQSLITAFNEDRDMITAQCRNLGADSAAQMQVLWMDAALVQFRRLRERMIRDESATG